MQKKKNIISYLFIIQNKYLYTHSQNDMFAIKLHTVKKS
jgi:hypothetical protein